MSQSEVIICLPKVSDPPHSLGQGLSESPAVFRKGGGGPLDFKYIVGGTAQRTALLWLKRTSGQALPGPPGWGERRASHYCSGAGHFPECCPRVCVQRLGRCGVMYD